MPLNVEASPEKGHEGEQRAGICLPWGMTEKVEVVQPGEENPMRHYRSLLVLEKGWQEGWKGAFKKKHVMIGQGVKALN